MQFTVRYSLSLLLLLLLGSCALLAPAPEDDDYPVSSDPPVLVTPNDDRPVNGDPPPAPPRPRPANNFADEFSSAALQQLLTPNDPSLSYPIYSRFDELQPLLNQRDGVTYIINFWASWCRPCIREMPVLEQFEANNDNVKVVAVSLDRPDKVRTEMKELVRTHNWQLPIIALTDDNYDSWRSRVSPRWSRTTIPVTYVYRNGRSAFSKGALSSSAELRGLVRKVQ